MTSSIIETQLSSDDNANEVDMTLPISEIKSTYGDNAILLYPNWNPRWVPMSMIEYYPNNVSATIWQSSTPGYELLLEKPSRIRPTITIDLSEANVSEIEILAVIDLVLRRDYPIECYINTLNVLLLSRGYGSYAEYMLFRYADSETYVSKYPNDMLAKALSQTKNLRNGTAFYQLMSKAYSKNEKMAKNYKSLGIEISDNLLLTLAVKDEEPISASELSSGEVGDIKLMTVCLDTLTNGLFSVIFADNPTNDILASGGLVTASMEPVNVEANTEEYIKSIISRYPNKSTSSFAALEIIIKQADDYSQINDYITKGINNCRCLHTSDKNTIYSIKSDRYTCYLAVCIGDSNLCRANPDPYGRCYYDGKDVHYFPSGYLTMISEDPIENGRPKRPLDVILSKVIS